MAGGRGRQVPAPLAAGVGHGRAAGQGAGPAAAVTEDGRTRPACRQPGSVNPTHTSPPAKGLGAGVAPVAEAGRAKAGRGPGSGPLLAPAWAAVGKEQAISVHMCEKAFRADAQGGGGAQAACVGRARRVHAAASALGTRRGPERAARAPHRGRGSGASRARGAGTTLTFAPRKPATKQGEPGWQLSARPRPSKPSSDAGSARRVTRASPPSPHGSRTPRYAFIRARS